MKSVLFGFLALLMVAGATTPRNRQDAGRYALASRNGEIRKLLSRRLSAMPKGLKRNWQRISVFPHRGRGRCGVKVEPSSLFCIGCWVARNQKFGGGYDW